MRIGVVQDDIFPVCSNDDETKEHIYCLNVNIVKFACRNGRPVTKLNADKPM